MRLRNTEHEQRRTELLFIQIPVSKVVEGGAEICKANEPGSLNLFQSTGCLSTGHAQSHFAPLLSFPPECRQSFNELRGGKKMAGIFPVCAISGESAGGSYYELQRNQMQRKEEKHFLFALSRQTCDMKITIPGSPARVWLTLSESPRHNC